MMKKRMYAIILALLLLVGAVPVGSLTVARAEEEGTEILYAEPVGSELQAETAASSESGGWTEPAAQEPEPALSEEPAPAEETTTAEEPAPAEETTPAEETAPAEEPAPSPEPASAEEPAPVEESAPAAEETEDYEILLFEETDPVTQLTVSGGTAFGDLALPGTLTAVVLIPGAAEAGFAAAPAPEESGYEDLSNGLYAVPEALGGGYRVYGSAAGMANDWWACDSAGVLYGLVMEVPVVWNAGAYDPSNAGDYTISAEAPDFLYNGAAPTIQVTVEETAGKNVKKAGPRKAPASGTVIDKDTYWGHWDNWDVTGDITIAEGGTLYMEGTAPQIYNGTITNRTNKEYAIIVRPEHGTKFRLHDETVQNTAASGIACTWNNATMTFENVTLDGGNLNYNNAFILQTCDSGSHMVFKGDNTIRGFLNAGLNAQSNDAPFTVESGTLAIENSSLTLARFAAINVKSDASLVLDNASLSGGSITVPSGATLTVKGNSEISSKIIVQAGGALDLTKSTTYNEGTLPKNVTFSGTGSTLRVGELQSIVVPNGQKLTLKDNAIDEDNTDLGVRKTETTTTINGTKVTIKADKIASLDKLTITVESGGKLILDGEEKKASAINFEIRALLELKNGAKFEIEEGKTLELGKVDVTSRDCELSGKGTLDMKGRIIDIQKGSLTSENLTIANATINDDDFTLENGTLNNTTINVSSGDTTTLTNCKVTNCNFNVAVGGTLIVDGGTVTTNNYDVYQITNSGTVKISNGAKLTKVWINNNKDVTIDGSDLNDCIIKNTSGSTLDIKDSKLHDSYRWTSQNSQGIHETMIHGTNSTITLTNTELTNNKNDSTDEGGSIISVLNSSTLTLDKVTGKDNTAKTWGGLVYSNNSDITIKDSTFDGNTASNNGGGVVCQVGGKLDITKSEFKNNLSGGQFSAGGAIYKNGGELTIDDDSTFSNNYVGRYYGNAANDDLSFGGAIYLTKATATIGASTFKENGCALDWSHVTRNGGAIYAAESEVTLNGTNFTENYTWNGANAGGGAVFFTGNKTGVTDKTQATAHLYVNGAKFTGNGTTTYGGALTVRDGAYAKILDLNGDPTEFKKNYVEWGTDFSGGALFIDMAYVEMEDAAIYNNYADDAGGGIAACSTGTTDARSLNGAAIFGNTVDANSRITPDASTHQDIFFQTITHKDENGNDLQDRKNFPEFKYELYERMFNGGLHKWKVKSVKTINGQKETLDSLVAQSDPTSKVITGAKVIFTENVAKRYNNNGVILQASGGAIGCNGLLEIGTSTEVKILKVWDDADNIDGYRPTKEDYQKMVKVGKLTLQDKDGKAEDLAAGGILVDVVDAKDYDLASNVATGMDATEKDELKKLVDAGNTYLIIISGLSGKAEDYEVVSDNVGRYTSALYKDQAGNGNNRVIVNSHTPERVDIAVEKVWDDDDNRDGVRPKKEKVTVHLLADGKETSMQAELSADNDWAAVFKDLPKYKTGTDNAGNVTVGVEIDYTVKEDAVEGYELGGIEKVEADEIYKNRKEYTEIYDELDNAKIEDLDGSVKADANESTGFKITNTHTPETVNISAKKKWEDENDADGIRPEKITVKILADGKDSGKTLELTAENNWKGSITGLEKYRDQGKEIKYTLEEAQVEGYESDVSGNAADGFTLVNKHTPELITIDVFKLWNDGDNKDGLRPSGIAVVLLKDGEEFQQAVLNEGNGWHYSFEQLQTSLNGKEIKYEVKEVEVPEGYTSTVKGDKGMGFVITNTYAPYGDQTVIRVNKVWDDDQNADGIRPASVKVHLLADGKEINSAELSEANSWMATFGSLPVKENGRVIVYELREDPVEGYTSSLKGAGADGNCGGCVVTFTNTHKPNVPTPTVTPTPTATPVPTVTTRPLLTPTAVNSTSGVATPKTGDDNHMLPYLLLGLAAVGCLCAIGVTVRKRRRDE